MSAKIRLSDDVFAKLLPHNLACYTGKLHATDRDCSIALSETTKSITVTTTKRLNAGENLTFAIGFKNDTFTGYQKSKTEVIKETAGQGGAILIAALGGIGLLSLKKLKPSAKVAKTIVTQFVPPKNSEIYNNAALISSDKLATASLIDLAVQHKIKITEQKKKGLFGSKQYTLEIINTSKLTAHDCKFMKIFFGNKLSDGETYTTKPNDYDVGRRLTAYRAGLTTQLRADEIYQNNNSAKSKVTIAGVLAFLGGIGLFFLLDKFAIDVTASLAVPTILGIVLGVITIAIANLPRLTQKGAELKAYLLGLKTYISAAETERLKFAQSVEAAEREIVQESSEKQGKTARIVLYERLLPYAILFGLEKSWSKELEKLYTENPDYLPAWYIGAQAFNAGNFTKSLQSFSSSVSSYSSSSSSSGGGGFSGGGGGEGGGGGC